MEYFSEKSEEFLKKKSVVKNFKFKKFEMPFDLRPQKDPIRSWTIKSKKTINDKWLPIQPQTLLRIKLKDFRCLML